MWLVGIALPATPLLQLRLQHAMKALACAVGGGVILSSVVVAALCGIYAYLAASGMHPFLAFALPAGLGIAIGIFLLWSAMRQINAAAHLKDDLSLFPQTSRPAGDPLRDMAERLTAGMLPPNSKGSSLRDIASAFMDGLMNGHPPAAAPNPAATAPHAMEGNTEIRVSHGKGGMEFHLEKHASLKDQPFL